MANEGNTRGGPKAGGYRTLLAAHLAATALVLLEFALLQALATGITSAIYALAPAPDSGAPLKFAEWERIFRVISPTITVYYRIRRRRHRVVQHNLRPPGPKGPE